MKTMLRFSFLRSGLLVLAGTAAALLLAPAWARAAAGDLYVSDGGDNTIFEVTPAAGAGSPVATGLVSPSGLAFDAAGNLSVAEDGNNSILEISSTGSQGTFATGLKDPDGMAFDAAGDLYAAESDNAEILKFSAGGTESLFATLAGNPSGLAVGALGNVYSTVDGGSIDKFSPTGAGGFFAGGFYEPGALAFMVPEPSTWVLVAGASLLFSLAVRRRLAV